MRARMSTFEWILAGGFLFIVALAAIVLLRWASIHMESMVPVRFEPVRAPWRA